MEISIDKTISELEILKKNTFSYMTANQAFTTAIEIMRKYQTMQEVLEKVWNVPSCMLDEAECLNQIMETYRTVR